MLRNLLWGLWLYLGTALAVTQLTYQPIYFDLNSDVLSDASKESLARVKALLEANPTAKLKVVGHSGSNETEAKALTEKRAKVTHDYLLGELKIAAERLSFSGSEPFSVESGDTERANESRRVEFEFMLGDVAAPAPTAAKQPLEEINVIYWNTLYHSLYHIGTTVIDPKQPTFFEREGFKVNLIATNHSYSNQVKAACSVEPFLKSGELVFTGAVCGGSPHEAIAQGVPLVIIGGMLAGGSMLIAKPEKAKLLKASWQNFKGTKLGRPKGTVLTAMIISDALARAGLDPKKDVTWIEYDSHEQIVEEIANGTLDAGDTYVPVNVQAKKKYGIVEVYNTVELFPYHPCCRVITTRSKLEGNKKRYIRFMRALLRSHEFYVTKPMKAYEIIQKNTGYTMEEVKLSLQNKNFMINPDPLKKGGIKFWAMMNATGFIKSDKKFEEFVDTSIYKAALEELIRENPGNGYYTFMMQRFIEQN